MPFLALFLVFLVQADSPDPQALEWFQKGEELIGTAQEFSDLQAEYFARAVERAPHFQAARFNLALIYLHQNKPSKALEQLEALLRLDDQDPRVYHLRAQARLATGDSRGARADLEKALELDPNNDRIWESLAHLQVEAREYRQALESFQKIVELRPSVPPELSFDMALCQQNLERFDEAADNYRKFLEAFPEDFQANFFLGLIYRRKGDDAEALRHLLAAEAQNPNHRELQEELGNLYLDLGRLEEARKRLDRVGAASAVNLSNLGVIAKREGRPAEAEEYFRRALERESSNPLIWGHLADVLWSQGKEEEAADAYRRALDNDPQDFHSLSNLGALYANQDRLQESRSLLEQAIALRPEAGEAHYHLGIVLERLQEPSRAQAHYLQALEHGVDDARLHFRLAVLYARQSEKEAALRHLEIAFQKEPEKYLAVVREELRNVRSDLDSIRYTPEFHALLSRYEKHRP